MADSSRQMQSGVPLNTPRSARRATPTEASYQQTPALVTFAAVMLGLLGGFQIIWSFIEFANAAWFSTAVYGNFGGHLWIWGIVDLLFGLASLYAGYSLIVGGRFGQVYGLIVAGISAMRWFFYLPASPWAGVVMIAIDALIIYGLVKHADYFSANGQLTVG